MKHLDQVSLNPHDWVWSSERDSPFIPINDLAVRVTHPHQRRSGIRHYAEAFLALTQNGLGLALSRALPQQSRNQQRLGDDQHDGSNDVFAAALPETLAPGREPPCPEAEPTPEYASVEAPASPPPSENWSRPRSEFLPGAHPPARVRLCLLSTQCTSPNRHKPRQCSHDSIRAFHAQ